MTRMLMAICELGAEVELLRADIRQRKREMEDRRRIRELEEEVTTLRAAKREAEDRRRICDESIHRGDDDA